MPPSVNGAVPGLGGGISKHHLTNEPLLILAAVIVVYIVLGVLYESYIHPITILSTLPSAGVGRDSGTAAVSHRPERDCADRHHPADRHREEGMRSWMIDFALEAERDQGMEPEEAIYQACLLRFRPIMMTTMAALLGGVPLALGTGTGSELRRPLGIAIVGGLIVSQVLTLFTTPVVYLCSLIASGGSISIRRERTGSCTSTRMDARRCRRARAPAAGD